MGANIWNLSARRTESLSKADADRRNQLMLESPSRSDGDLLRLLSGGDEKAFVEFYRKHQGMVLPLRAPDERQNRNCRRSNAGRIRGGDELGRSLRQRARVGGGVSVWNRPEFRAAGFGAGEAVCNRVGRSGRRLRGPAARDQRRNRTYSATWRRTSASKRCARRCWRCRRPIARWWCCAICTNETTPRRRARWDARLERCDRGCIGRGRCWPRRCAPVRGVRYERKSCELLEGLRALAADGPREAPRTSKNGSGRSFDRQNRRRNADDLGACVRCCGRCRNCAVGVGS